MSNLLLFMGLSLFVFNETVRPMLNKSVLNDKFNLLFIFVGLAAISYMFLSQHLDLRVIVMTLAVTGLALIALRSGSGKLSHEARMIATISMPLLITGFRLPEVDLTPFMRNWVRIFNIICITLVVVGIFDYLSGASLQLYWASHHVFAEDLALLVYDEHDSGIYRYYSFIGHPLTNAWYLLTFYTFNILYNRRFKPLLNEYLLIFITLIGLLLAGSRTALLIGLLMFIFLNNSKYKLALLSLLSILGTGLYSTSLFKNNLLQRFKVNVAAGDFSGGRNEALSWVLGGYIRPPAFFTGGGLSSSYLITANMDFIKSFEYPFIMLAYDLGIMTTVLIYATIFIIPLAILVRNKTYGILAFFVLLAIYLNGFNGLANYLDFMGQFCFVVMVLINLSGLGPVPLERTQVL